MPYDKLFENAARYWHSLTPEYQAWTVAALVIAAVLIRNRIRIKKRIRRIETQLQRMQDEIGVLQIQNSRDFMTKLNAKSEVESGPYAVEVENGDVARRTISPPTMPGQSESKGR